MLVAGVGIAQGVGDAVAREDTDSTIALGDGQVRRGRDGGRVGAAVIPRRGVGTVAAIIGGRSGIADLIQAGWGGADHGHGKGS